MLSDHESRVLDESAKHSAVGNLLAVRNRKMKFARCCRAPDSIACPRFAVHPCNLGDFRCDPNLQSLPLSLRRSSARRLLRLLRANPRPARPVKETSVGATSGKKTKHEKGMTTGSSRRSGANAGDAANPSDQGSGAGPKNGGKYLHSFEG